MREQTNLAKDAKLIKQHVLMSKILRPFYGHVPMPPACHVLCLFDLIFVLVGCTTHDESTNERNERTKRKIAGGCTTSLVRTKREIARGMYIV